MLGNRLKIGIISYISFQIVAGIRRISSNLESGSKIGDYWGGAVQFTEVDIPNECSSHLDELLELKKLVKAHNPKTTFLYHV